MGIEEIWQEEEKLLEEESGYAMRELREKREFIEGFEGKFSTKAVLGENCFSQIIKYIQEENPSNWSLAELCIRRQNVIVDLKSKAIKDALLEIDIHKAETLWNIIKYEILPMEIFWSMEYAEGNDFEFSDEENDILSYMREIAQLYLDKTNDLASYAEELNLSELL